MRAENERQRAALADQAAADRAATERERERAASDRAAAERERASAEVVNFGQFWSRRARRRERAAYRRHPNDFARSRPRLSVPPVPLAAGAARSGREGVERERGVGRSGRAARARR
jgi:hypothetical protein